MDAGEPSHGRGSRGARDRPTGRDGAGRSEFAGLAVRLVNVGLVQRSRRLVEELTLSGQLNELRMQVPDAWPNQFRQARFLSAVDFVQADGSAPDRRGVPRILSEVDLLLVPSLRDEILTIANFTGHFHMRAGFVEVSQARE